MNLILDTSKPPPEDRPKGRRGLERVIRGLVIGRRAGAGLLVLGVLYTIYFARSLLLPILLALLLAAFLQPFVRKLNRLKIPNSAGAAIVLLVFVGVLGTAIYELSAPASDWMARGPDLLKKAEYKVWRVKQSIKKAEEKTQQLEEMTTLGESK